jgi:hypothetical protein
MIRLTTRQRAIIGWTLGVTVVAEAVTAALRFCGGLSATDFDAASPPLLLQIHQGC